MEQDVKLSVALRKVREYILGARENNATYGYVNDASVSKWLTVYKVLVKAYGTEEDEWELLEFVERHSLGSIPIAKEVTQGDVYGFIKELEFTRGYADNLRELTQEQELMLEEIDGLLNVLAGVFNQWITYSGVVNSDLSVKVEPEEFSYEELVGRGEQPDYNKPMSRVERRKRK